ncbi:hypothetical protein CANMA_003262 [Candida margitis]|uniref:uncharacterized protein n=1 Tax=Candida margitis TaxID=1775924 RepID=UPI0022262483|nr:uncharacterized protein CANMA_003262 [Candida margitis]KAI5967205.1 hypothetical protein CANMA_003262 [Candida margitis]
MSSVLVSDVPSHISAGQLRCLFQYAGTISSIIPLKRETLQDLRQYEIIYMSPQAVSTALLLDDVELQHGCFLQVRRYQERPMEMNGFASHHNGQPTLQQLRKEDIEFTLDYAYGQVFNSGNGANQDPVPTADIDQEYKPKTVILAEIIAGGYDLADDIIERGAKFDKRYGVSARFQNFIDSLNDYSLKAKGKQKRAYENDQLKKYFDEISVNIDTATPSVDARVSSFYKTVDNNDVRDIRNEAMKLAQHNGQGSGRGIMSN